MSRAKTSKGPRFYVVFEDSARHGSPHRLVRADRRQVSWVNTFLDAMVLRGLSPLSARTYAYALRSICQWLAERSLKLEDVTEAHLPDFILYLRTPVPARNAPHAPRTINLKLLVLRAIYAFHHQDDLPAAAGAPREAKRIFARRSYPFTGMPHGRVPRRSKLRVKVPRELIEALSPQSVQRFLEGLRTDRDLAITSLMLFSGLRSCEVLALRLKDLHLDQGEIRVRGKGGKQRMVPVAEETRALLDRYLRLERPASLHGEVFLVLKGARRSHPMTRSGLRSIFRYHRQCSRVLQAKPHRFRHTFASDMVRAGISLPALQRLMGHANIATTMCYVHLSLHDLREEFLRTVARILRQRDGKDR